MRMFRLVEQRKVVRHNIFHENSDRITRVQQRFFSLKGVVGYKTIHEKQGWANAFELCKSWKMRLSYLQPRNMAAILYFFLCSVFRVDEAWQQKSGTFQSGRETRPFLWRFQFHLWSGVSFKSYFPTSLTGYRMISCKA